MPLPTVSIPSLLLILTSITASLADRTCYWSNGALADGYSACSNTTTHSGCCRTWQINNLTPDVCTGSGLCLARNGQWNGMFFQSACTDPTWASADCPKACPVLSTSESSLLQPCNATGGGLWCCRTDGSGSCCASARTIAIGQILIPTSTATIVLPSSLIASSTTTSTSASLTSSSTSTTNTPTNAALSVSASCPPNATDADSGKAQANVNTATIGVGASLGVAFLVTLAMLIYRERSWRKRPTPITGFVNAGMENASEKAPTTSTKYEVSPTPTMYHAPAYHELGRYEDDRPHEMGSPGHGRLELDGNGNRF